MSFLQSCSRYLLLGLFVSHLCVFFKLIFGCFYLGEVKQYLAKNGTNFENGIELPSIEFHDKEEEEKEKYTSKKDTTKDTTKKTIEEDSDSFPPLSFAFKCFVLFIAVFPLSCTFFTFDSVASVAPALEREGIIDTAKLGYLYMAYSVIGIPAGLIFGIVIDKKGITIPQIVGMINSVCFFVIF